MNLIEALNNKFLNQLFPNGIKNDILLGQVYLNLNYSVEISIHIYEKPNIEVSKYGIWGVNYDVMVLELTAQSIKELSIKHWQNVSYCKLSFTSKDGEYFLKFSGDDWEVTIESKSLIFQSISTYIK